MDVADQVVDFLSQQVPCKPSLLALMRGAVDKVQAGPTLAACQVACLGHEQEGVGAREGARGTAAAACQSAVPAALMLELSADSHSWLRAESLAVHQASFSCQLALPPPSASAIAEGPTAIATPAALTAVSAASMPAAAGGLGAATNTVPMPAPILAGAAAALRIAQSGGATTTAAAAAAAAAAVMDAEVAAPTVIKEPCMATAPGPLPNPAHQHHTSATATTFNAAGQQQPAALSCAALKPGLDAKPAGNAASRPPPASGCAAPGPGLWPALKLALHGFPDKAVERAYCSWQAGRVASWDPLLLPLHLLCLTLLWWQQGFFASGTWHVMSGGQGWRADSPTHASMQLHGHAVHAISNSAKQVPGMEGRELGAPSLASQLLSRLPHLLPHTLPVPHPTWVYIYSRLLLLACAAPLLLPHASGLLGLRVGRNLVVGAPSRPLPLRTACALLATAVLHYPLYASGLTAAWVPLGNGAGAGAGAAGLHEQQLVPLHRLVSAALLPLFMQTPAWMMVRVITAQTCLSVVLHVAGLGGGSQPADLLQHLAFACMTCLLYLGLDMAWRRAYARHCMQ
ncbi:hypothetical protein V8C86DRAFT_2810700 [Haematococcus lacustris]